MKVFTVAEMVSAEKSADAAGHSYDEMMERAGQSLAEAITERVDVTGKNILVLVGPGNNGGDGLVAGRYLAQAGADVAFYLFKPRDAAQDVNFAKIQEMGLFAVDAGFDQRHRVLRTRLNISDIVIDGLLGTGVARPIGGDLAQLMRQAATGIAERTDILRTQHDNARVTLTAPHLTKSPSPRPFIVAVDCPSGLNCDTGALDPLALPADLTVTFAGPKRGHFVFPGAAACGELVVTDIGIDPALTADVPVTAATPQLMGSLLPFRPKDGHKGTFGFALIAAGSRRYWGAPALAGLGALRAGCGLVALAVPAQLRPSLAMQLPEATYLLIPDAEDLGSASAETLLKHMQRYDALLVGPGLGPDSAEFLHTLFAAPDLPPLVIDADGLNYLAQQAEWWKHIPPGSILTPHPGEMARLVGEGIDDGDRIALALEKSAEWNQIVVLKGAYTVIATPEGEVTLIPIATPALAVAGSGDVLAGVIVSLLAQKVSPYNAARLGAYLHARAGLHAAQVIGAAGVLAREIADHIPSTRTALLQGR
ncbi:MAG: NAD(P)H-hydrate dehydratase [Anaerolineae bacterium]|nr:NAD(P)H-hydrate dehydratase [Anaerolineae bacterium]